MNFKISKILLFVFYFGLCLLTFFSLLQYPGRGYIYIFFSIAFNGLLLAGFRKNKIFFDTFIGLFFWLGFWFKFSVVLLFRGGYFPDSVGNFDFSGSAFDRALLVSSVGAIAFIAASFVRGNYFSYAKSHVINENRSILDVYKRYRNIILASFVFLFVMIAGTNIWLGIYQRGLAPQTILPFGLNGVYTWLLLFGLTSFSAVFLDCEFRINKNPYLIAFLSLLETFCSNVSMLSRGMILNTSALILGVHEDQKTQVSFLNIRSKIIILTAVIVLFISSVFMVNIMRLYRFPIDSTEIILSKAISGSYHPHSSILINHWVGIEAAMAVSSYPNLGWGLWAQSWQEKFSNTGTSFYDKEIAKSQYAEENLLNRHFISLPGILAFFYYPGSYVMLFFSMVLLGIFGALMEIVVYKLSYSNIILCSLMAEVIAYRYAHFGYVPKQSYLLIGTIVLNVLIIYFLNKMCKRSVMQSVHVREQSTAGQ
jgi:hypothetical protein